MFRNQDLLEQDRCNLQVREDIKRGVIIEGLSYKICETANNALDLINMSLVVINLYLKQQ